MFLFQSPSIFPLSRNFIASSSGQLVYHFQKVMAPVQSRMGAIFGVTIYYFRFFLVRNYFIIFLTADWLPSV